MKQDLLELLGKKLQTFICKKKVWAEATCPSKKTHSDTLFCVSASKIGHKSREFAQPIIYFLQINDAFHVYSEINELLIILWEIIPQGVNFGSPWLPSIQSSFHTPATIF